MMKPASHRDLFSAIAVCLLFAGSIGAAERSSVLPNFATDDETNWIPVGDDYLAPESGAGPVTFDPAHPYVPNFTPGKAPTICSTTRSGSVEYPGVMSPDSA